MSYDQPMIGLFAGRSPDGNGPHCARCAEVGHVVAHPDLGCGDVGCVQGHEPLITRVPADDGKCLCTATTPIQVMVPGTFGFTDARLYCDAPAGHPGRHRAETSEGTKHWEGPTRPVGPLGDAVTDMARNLAVPEADARQAGQQAEQVVDDQLAVVRAVADLLARTAWDDDNRNLATQHRKPWVAADLTDRAPYLAPALATAARLVISGLLAPRLPDTDEPVGD